jgi:hypothetical protein
MSAGLTAVAMTVGTASSALATPYPPWRHGRYGTGTVTRVVASGMPGWQIALIAAGAAIVAAALTLFAARRRYHAGPARMIPAGAARSGRGVPTAASRTP